MFWQETGLWFPGTVVVAEDSGACDIMYDEKVDGFPCVEKNVPPQRIQVLPLESSSFKGLAETTPDPSTLQRDAPIIETAHGEISEGCPKSSLFAISFLKDLAVHPDEPYSRFTALPADRKRELLELLSATSGTTGNATCSILG